MSISSQFDVVCIRLDEGFAGSRIVHNECLDDALSIHLQKLNTRYPGHSCMAHSSPNRSRSATTYALFREQMADVNNGLRDSNCRTFVTTAISLATSNINRRQSNVDNTLDMMHVSWNPAPWKTGNREGCHNYFHRHDPPPARD